MDSSSLCNTDFSALSLYESLLLFRKKLTEQETAFVERNALLKIDSCTPEELNKNNEDLHDDRFDKATLSPFHLATLAAPPSVVDKILARPAFDFTVKAWGCYDPLTFLAFEAELRDVRDERDLEKKGHHPDTVAIMKKLAEEPRLPFAASVKTPMGTFPLVEHMFARGNAYTFVMKRIIADRQRILAAPQKDNIVRALQSAAQEIVKLGTPGGAKENPFEVLSDAVFFSAQALTDKALTREEPVLSTSALTRASRNVSELSLLAARDITERILDGAIHGLSRVRREARNAALCAARFAVLRVFER